MSAPCPASFPIFPLPDYVLFPELEAGFHIFEPRYRAMTRIVLEGDGVIGMMLIRPGEDSMAQRARVFEIGCAGRIVRSFGLSGGRFKLELAGVRRFRVLEDEVQVQGFRQAQVALLEDPCFTDLPPTVRNRVERLSDELRRDFLQMVGRGEEQGSDSLEKRLAPLDPIKLVHTIASWIAGSPVERQVLLEAPDVERRARLLLATLEIHRAERIAPNSLGTIH